MRKEVELYRLVNLSILDCLDCFCIYSGGVIRICDIITDGLNNVFADVDSIHKTDLLEVRLRVRAAANIPLTDKVAKRPHFWEVLSSLLINIFAKIRPTLSRESKC